MPAKSSAGASTTLPTRQSQNAIVSGATRACRSRLERMSSTAKVSADPIPQASATQPNALPSSPASATRAMPMPPGTSAPSATFDSRSGRKSGASTARKSGAV